MAATYRQHGDSDRESPGGDKVLYAEMRQPAGPVYPSRTRAAYVLGHRAVKAGLLSAPDLSGRLSTTGFDDVPERTVRFWVNQEPHLPEQIVRGGLMQTKEFPLWSRQFLRLDNQIAEMGQQSVTKVSDDNTWESVVEGAGKVLAIYVGVKLTVSIIDWLSAQKRDRPSRIANRRSRRRSI